MKFDQCEINNGIIKTIHLYKNQFVHLKRINNIELFNANIAKGYPDGLYLRVYNQGYWYEYLLSRDEKEYKIIQEEIEKIIGFSIDLNEKKIFNKDIYFENGILYFENYASKKVFFVMKNVTRIKFHKKANLSTPDFFGYSSRSTSQEQRETTYTYRVYFNNDDKNSSDYVFQDQAEYDKFFHFIKDLIMIKEEKIKIEDSNIELIL